MAFGWRRETTKFKGTCVIRRNDEKRVSSAANQSYERVCGLALKYQLLKLGNVSIWGCQFRD